MFEDWREKKRYFHKRILSIIDRSWAWVIGKTEDAELKKNNS